MIIAPRIIAQGIDKGVVAIAINSNMDSQITMPNSNKPSRLRVDTIPFMISSTLLRSLVDKSRV